MRGAFRSITIIFGMLAMFTVARCGGDDMKDAEKNMVLVGMITFMQQSNYSLVDNQDGTVSLQAHDFFGNLLSNSIYKKCLQGQVYRPLPDNDCRGAGNLTNAWGAALLQWCNANDLSCSQGGYVQGANSQIFTSCANDTTAGLSWYPWYFFGVMLLDKAYIKNFENIFTDIPLNSGIWTASEVYYYGGIDRAEYVVIPYSGRRFALKTSLKYVLCGNKVPW